METPSFRTAETKLNKKNINFKEQIKLIKMDIQTIKVDLIHWLTELQDPKILEQLQALKHLQEGGLSDAHKALLDERIASFEKDSGRALDWDEVMKEIEKDL